MIQAMRTAADREKGDHQGRPVDSGEWAGDRAHSETAACWRTTGWRAGAVHPGRHGLGSEALRDRLEELFRDLSELGVDDSKRETLDMGELAASAFTTIFIVAGLFGITAGLVLIFLIFVMLAAERKPEMGMVRAVGAQRGHLVNMFVFEGRAYDLEAAAVGMALGVSIGMIIAITLGRAFAGSGLTIHPNISPRSLIVSYSLGMLVTFATVLFSANRVSRLNIVSAIRDLPEPPRPPSYLRDRLLAPFKMVADGFRALFRLRPLQALQAWLVGCRGACYACFGWALPADRSCCCWGCISPRWASRKPAWRPTAWVYPFSSSAAGGCCESCWELCCA